MMDMRIAEGHIVRLNTTNPLHYGDRRPEPVSDDAAGGFEYTYTVAAYNDQGQGEMGPTSR